MENKQKVTGSSCDYKCVYYQDGAVFSLYNKYKEILKYSNGKPQALKECLDSIYKSYTQG